MIPLNNYQTETRRLDSGAIFFEVNIPGSAIFSFSAWLPAGSRFDPRGQEGAAHFLEHLMMFDTKGDADGKIDKLRKLETGGISYNAFTDKEYVRYFTISLSDKSQQAVDFILNGLINSEIREEQVKKEKGVILDEYDLFREDIQSYIFSLNDSGLWPNGDLGHSILGNRNSIESMGVNNLSVFRCNNYSKAPIFVVVGDTKKFNFFDYINDKIKNLKFEEEILKTKNQKTPTPTKLIYIDKRNKNRINVIVGFRTCSFVDWHQVVVLNFIKNYLANGWVSKLNESLRLKNDLTYWVEGYSNYFSDTGSLKFSFSVEKKDINKSLSLFFTEINKLKEELVSSEVLEKHKFSQISDIIKNLSDNKELIYWYRPEKIITDKVINPDIYVKNLINITPNDIFSVAKKFFNQDDLSITLVGDIDSKDIKSKNFL